MIISVTNERGEDYEYEMSRLAFIKHFWMAWQWYGISLRKLRRIFGMFFHYIDYLNPIIFGGENGFSQPLREFSDPTEKAQFSNLAWKTIADFLSRKINNSIFSINYEAAMRILGMPIQWRRPDLFVYRNIEDWEFFAIESKWFSRSQISEEDMVSYKEQSQEWWIPVSFSIASVSYDLYNRVKCNYYDPPNKKYKFDEELFEKIIENYYTGLLEVFDFFNNKREDERIVEWIIEFGGEFFYKLNLYNIYVDMMNLYQMIWFDRVYIKPFWFFEGMKLLIPKDIKEIVNKGLNKEHIQPFKTDFNKNNIYIDNDRIGLMIE